MTEASIETGADEISLTPKGERYCAEQANKEYFVQLVALRREAWAEIYRLIDLLDRLGGDPDLEEDGSDEPTLGWPARGPTSSGTGNDDEEEPSLGWTSTTRQEGKHWHGTWVSNDPLHIDIEADKADDEDNGDREPSIGGDDREDDPAEAGIADQGGMQDQYGSCELFSYDGEGNRVAGEMLAAVRYGGSRHIDPTPLPNNNTLARPGNEPVYIDQQGRRWVGLVPIEVVPMMRDVKERG